jgi:hypothetical protein
VSKWVRQSHRGVAIGFTVTVIVNFVALGLGQGQPPAWVTYSPLLPLAVLLLTGLYLFVLPYALTECSAGRTTKGRVAHASGTADRTRNFSRLVSSVDEPHKAHDDQKGDQI